MGAFCWWLQSGNCLDDGCVCITNPGIRRVSRGGTGLCGGYVRGQVGSGELLSGTSCCGCIQVTV